MIWVVGYFIVGLIVYLVFEQIGYIDQDLIESDFEEELRRERDFEMVEMLESSRRLFRACIFAEAVCTWPVLVAGAIMAILP